MQYKTVCQLNHAGYFVGLTEADESPLEPGVFLLPAGCVDVDPPQMQDGQRARWVAGAWQFEAAELPPEQEPLPQDPVEQVKQQIEAIERQTLMNRALREFMLEQTVRETARDYNLDLSVPGNRELVQNGLYAGNVAYRKIKDIDTQIVALRAQIGMA